MRLRNDRRELRIVEGKQRNDSWATLSPEQKIAILDSRLGKGVGAKRQRKLLTGK